LAADYAADLLSRCFPY